ncbi:MAG: hypothetical protein PHO62_07750 [Sulfurimonas sp.]|uniref:hypothetical protein n=1 Tax=Sulfurimonas sp. TaxID=2022749 RepID=UPI00262A94D7|nr:hypothetical protein [Sulfurimonas sp.]MDD5373300.1 hypothetical protein [Sulfurimonas sp.]
MNKVSNGFETENELEESGFSDNAISDDDVYDMDEDDEEEFEPEIAVAAMSIVVERTKKNNDVGSFGSTNVQVVDFPTFFEINKDIFEPDNLALSLCDKEGRVEFDLDNEDPLMVADKVKEMYYSSQIKAQICDYVSSEKFETVEFTDLKILVGEDKEAYLLNMIEKLIRNQSLKSKREFLEKLYKLRPVKVLIEEALTAEMAIDHMREFKGKVKGLIQEWESRVKEKIQYDMTHIKSLRDSKVDDREIRKLQQENFEIEDKYEIQIKKLEEQLSEQKQMYFAFVSSVNEIIDEQAEDNSPDALLALISRRLEQSASEDITDVSDEELKKEIEALKEEIEMLRDTSEDIENRLQEALDNNKVLVVKIEDLEKENRELKKEIEISNSSATTPITAAVQKNSSEDEESQEPEGEEAEKPKKNSKMKNIIVGTVSVIGAIAVLVGFLAWFVGGDTPPQKANYAAHVDKKEQTVVPSTVVPTPAPATVGIPEPVTNPAEVRIAPSYDFEAKLSEMDFTKQKFDIYTADLSKIRVNGRDFFANDIINGYRFIKATMAGKMLFIKDNKEPFWVEMK